MVIQGVGFEPLDRFGLKKDINYNNLPLDRVFFFPLKVRDQLRSVFSRKSQKYYLCDLENSKG